MNRNLNDAFREAAEMPDGPEKDDFLREICEESNRRQAEWIKNFQIPEERYKYPGKVWLSIEDPSNGRPKRPTGLKPELIPYFRLIRDEDGRWSLNIFRSYNVTEDSMGSCHSPVTPLALVGFGASVVCFGLSAALLIRSLF